MTGAPPVLLPPDPIDPTQASSQDLEAAIAAQKLEIQRLFGAKDFAQMPEARRGLHQFLRAKTELRHRRPV